MSETNALKLPAQPRKPSQGRQITSPSKIIIVIFIYFCFFFTCFIWFAPPVRKMLNHFFNLHHAKHSYGNRIVMQQLIDFMLIFLRYLSRTFGPSCKLHLFMTTLLE